MPPLTKPLLALSTMLGVFFLLGFASFDPEIVVLKYPKSWPQPIYNFDKNPLTKPGIALGRHLFYDPILSIDSTISCSSCHLSFTAFTHVDHKLSHGVRDSIGTRNSPALMNLAWGNSFMWDGGVNHIDMQALAPISHPAEMGEDIKHVVEKLQRTGKYPPMFATAFGDETVTGERVLKALAQFELTIVSANSRYDKVMRNEPDVAFTPQEKNGYQLFQEHCEHCHTEPLFTNDAFANIGLPVDSALNDFGRMRITGNPADSLLFKTPTLRNIEFSFPYMHDGRFAKLHQVLDHYVEEMQDSPTLAPELQNGVLLTPEDRVDIIAFLMTLTDREFLFNPELGFPR